MTRSVTSSRSHHLLVIEGGFRDNTVVGKVSPPEAFAMCPTEAASDGTVQRSGGWHELQAASAGKGDSK